MLFKIRMAIYFGINFFIFMDAKLVKPSREISNGLGDSSERRALGRINLSVPGIYIFLNQRYSVHLMQIFSNCSIFPIKERNGVDQVTQLILMMIWVVTKKLICVAVIMTIAIIFQPVRRNII